jgi:hypothetical protein
MFGVAQLQEHFASEEVSMLPITQETASRNPENNIGPIKAA